MDLLTLSALDRGFALLGFAATALILTSLAFALMAVAFRIQHDRRAKRWDRMIGAWEPAMLDVLGGAAPAETLLARVADGQGPDFLSFLMTYVQRLRGEEQALVRTMAEPYLPTLVPLLEKGTAESRGNAVMMLARMGMPRYADEVARALRDESPTVAMLAARSLFRPEHDRHFPEVIQHLPRFGKWSRSYLAGMLVAGGPAVAPLLRDVLADRERSTEARAVAAEVLRALNDIDSVEVATRLLESETDREVVVGCLRILKQLGHADHVALVRGFAASPDPVVRAVAVSALGGLGGPSEAPLLLEKVDDPSFWVSLEATRGLVSVGNVEAVRRLAASEGRHATLALQVLAE